MIKGKSNMAIKQCNCKSKFQDERYGCNKRVHNIAHSIRKDGVAFRCTVCGKKKEREDFNG